MKRDSSTLCPYCGATLPPGAKFCASCGASLAAADQNDNPQNQAGSSCLNCGAELPPAAKFCSHCGHAVQAHDQEPPAETISEADFSPTELPVQVSSTENAATSSLESPVSQESGPETLDQITDSESSSLNPARPPSRLKSTLSRRTWITIGLVAAGIAVVFVLMANFSPRALFDKAISEQDYAKALTLYDESLWKDGLTEEEILDLQIACESIATDYAYLNPGERPAAYSDCCRLLLQIQELPYEAIQSSAADAIEMLNRTYAGL